MHTIEECDILYVKEMLKFDSHEISHTSVRIITKNYRYDK